MKNLSAPQEVSPEQTASPDGVRRWQLLAGVLMLLVPFLFLLDPKTRFFYSHVGEIFDQTQCFWRIIKQQAVTPFINIVCAPDAPGCHEEKMTFRYILPLLYRLTGSVWGVYVFQVAFGLIFILGALRLFFQLTGDRLASVCGTMSLIGIYPGSAFIYDIVGCGDAFAYGSMMIALLTRRPLLAFAFFQLAFWTDERAIVNSPLVALFWISMDRLDHGGIQDETRKRCLALALSWLVYFGIRFWISSRYHLTTSTANAGISFVLTHPAWLHIRKLIISFEGLWFLIGLLTMALWRQKTYIWGGLVLGTLLISIAVSVMVADTSRSLGYAFPIFFIALAHARQEYSDAFLKKVLVYTCVFCLLWPTRYLYWF